MPPIAVSGPTSSLGRAISAYWSGSTPPYRKLNTIA
jgi:hypothetical protein